MNIPENKELQKLSSHSQRLVFLSMEIARAASRLESRFWVKKLEKLVLKLLESKQQEKLDAAIEHLYDADLDAYNSLLEIIEASSESCVIHQDGTDYDVMLVVAPVLAWTRFYIPAGTLTKDLHQQLTENLSKYIFTANARFILAPDLYAVDQLPFSHTGVYSLMKSLVASVQGKTQVDVLLQQETVPFLADVRYLLAVVMVPESQPVFRWQEPLQSGEMTDNRQSFLEKWQNQVMPLLSNMLAGCKLELMLPDAFFGACRQADQQIRPASIHAAVNYLTNTLDIAAVDLRAVIAGFYETPMQESITEYRIGFSSGEGGPILYGVVWPVYGAEEAQQVLRMPPGREFLSKGQEKKNQLAEILRLLNELGIKCEKNHVERFPMEFCEECGAPLFADANAELVHAELPEESKRDTQLH